MKVRAREFAQCREFWRSVILLNSVLDTFQSRYGGGYEDEPLRQGTAKELDITRAWQTKITTEHIHIGHI